MLKKRNGIWQTHFTTPSGQRIRCSTKTRIKAEAQEYERKLKEYYYKLEKLGDKSAHYWQEAASRFLKEKINKRSIENYKLQLRWLNQHLTNKQLHEIDSDMIHNLIEIRSKEKVQANGKEINRIVSRTTVNRMLEVLRAVLRCTVDWNWMDKAPKVPMFEVENARVRWITKSQADRLVCELPEHLKPIVRFALSTGLRESNITGLTWDHVDLKRRIAWILATNMKTKKNLAVPLNNESIVVLREQIGNHDEYVFTYKGNPILKGNTTAFKKACKRAKLTNFRFHDLRHTWASWHVQNGTPLHILQELGGWTSYDMVKRYAHLSADHLNDYANNICKIEIIDTNLAQSKKR